MATIQIYGKLSQTGSLSSSILKVDYNFTGNPPFNHSTGSITSTTFQLLETINNWSGSYIYVFCDETTTPGTAKACFKSSDTSCTTFDWNIHSFLTPITGSGSIYCTVKVPLLIV